MYCRQTSQRDVIEVSHSIPNHVESPSSSSLPPSSNQIKREIRYLVACKSTYRSTASSRNSSPASSTITCRRRLSSLLRETEGGLARSSDVGLLKGAVWAVFKFSFFNRVIHAAHKPKL